MNLLRSKKDARLYFKYRDLNIDLGELKTRLIKLGYIKHVEGDRYLELKKLPSISELKNAD
jgi:hypothetical protein